MPITKKDVFSKRLAKIRNQVDQFFAELGLKKSGPQNIGIIQALDVCEFVMSIWQDALNHLHKCAQHISEKPNSEELYRYIQSEFALFMEYMTSLTQLGSETIGDEKNRLTTDATILIYTTLLWYLKNIANNLTQNEDFKTS